MITQNFHKNTIRHRKNSEWLQSSRNSEKPENDTKLKILKISRNCHKPSLPQGLEQFIKVTPCNEKCNFFILLSFISSVGGDSDPRSYMFFSSVGGDSDPRSYMFFSSVGGDSDPRSYMFFSSVGGDSDPRSYISSVGGDSDPRSYISSVGGDSDPRSYIL